MQRKNKLFKRSLLHHRHERIGDVGPLDDFVEIMPAARDLKGHLSLQEAETRSRTITMYCL